MTQYGSDKLFSSPPAQEQPASTNKFLNPSVLGYDARSRSVRYRHCADLLKALADANRITSKT